MDKVFVNSIRRIGALHVAALAFSAISSGQIVSGATEEGHAGKAIPAGADFAPTIANQTKAPAPRPPGMVWIPGGEFSMGNADPRGMKCGGPNAMQDARPIRRVYVDGFWMDAADVTNDQFAQFVRATGYITVAERKPTAAEFPGVPENKLVAGSLVFTPPTSAVPLNDVSQWWSFVPGANWRHPTGKNSDLRGRENFPVVQIAYADAAACATWCGKRLPTEAEWEFAARGGAAGQPYPWGDELQPSGHWRANTFQGEFPEKDTGADGFAGLAPVKSFPPSEYGLYDMAGNVWEWCSDWYRADYYTQLAAEKIARNPTGPESSFDPERPNKKLRVQRGGSFLCTDQYCSGYLVGSRGHGEINTGSNHVGFRCVHDAAKPRGARSASR